MSSSSSSPLGNNPAASAEVAAKYCKLYQTYKLAVCSAHFGPGAKALSGAPLYQWEHPAGTGIAACEQPPLLCALAAQRLPPELAKYLQH